MESVLQKAGVNLNGSIYSKTVHLLLYADDINIIEHKKRDVTATFNAIDCKSAHMVVTLNEAKSSMRCQEVETCSVPRYQRNWCQFGH